MRYISEPLASYLASLASGGLRLLVWDCVFVRRSPPGHTIIPHDGWFVKAQSGSRAPVCVVGVWSVEFGVCEVWSASPRPGQGQGQTVTVENFSLHPPPPPLPLKLLTCHSKKSKTVKYQSNMASMEIPVCVPATTAAPPVEAKDNLPTKKRPPIVYNVKKKEKHAGNGGARACNVQRHKHTIQGTVRYAPR